MQLKIEIFGKVEAMKGKLQNLKPQFQCEIEDEYDTIQQMVGKIQKNIGKFENFYETKQSLEYMEQSKMVEGKIDKMIKDLQKLNYYEKVMEHDQLDTSRKQALL